MLQLENYTITETTTDQPVTTNPKNTAAPTAYKLLSADSIAADVAAFLEEMPDVVCFSHLRWNFVKNRPQHLLSRFAQHGRLFYVEEPVLTDNKTASIEQTEQGQNITVVVPHLPRKLSEKEQVKQTRQLLGQFFIDRSLSNYLFWYYSPEALSYSDHFSPVTTVYDCVSLSHDPENASAKLSSAEQQLLQKADVVFTAGQSIYEARQHQHEHVFAFPNSIDVPHFAQARTIIEEPADQSQVPLIRMGFYGVIDERMDLGLLHAVAAQRPEWHIVMLGPVAGIDAETLPQLPNLHYLGPKSYDELPAYLSGWDVALLPLALNEKAAYSCPAQTPEYLAAGRPVVSTPIKDVVKPYGEMGLVQIAESADEFVTAIEKALEQNQDMVWQQKTDRFLKEHSWDLTWKNMVALIQQSLHGRLPEKP